MASPDSWVGECRREVRRAHGIEDKSTANSGIRAQWSSESDTRLPDHACLCIWRQKGGANNCTASRNYAYVRCVHDPVKGDGAAEKAAGR